MVSNHFVCWRFIVDLSSVHKAQQQEEEMENSNGRSFLFVMII